MGNKMTDQTAFGHLFERFNELGAGAFIDTVADPRLIEGSDDRGDSQRFLTAMHFDVRFHLVRADFDV